MDTYDIEMEPNAVIEWVRDILKTEVMVVKTDEEHKYLWGKGAVRMILITTIILPDFKFIFTTLNYNDKFSKLELKSLKVPQLKKILESRGISHFGYEDKNDLVKLVFSTGDINNEELSEIMSTTHDMTDIHFENERHFRDEVEHSNEDVWLIRIQKSDDVSSSFMDNTDWEKVKSILKPAGIKTGMLYCQSNSKCNFKKWNTLILKTPGSLTEYVGLKKPNAVIKWVRDTLKDKVMVVKTDDDHKYRWRENDVQMMLVLPLETEPPLFYLTLSAILRKRITFGIAYTNHAYPLKEKAFGNSITSLSTAKYFVSTPTLNFEYGKRSGEYLNFNRMKFMLNTLQLKVGSLSYIISLAVFCLCVLPDIYRKYCEEVLKDYILELIVLPILVYLLFYLIVNFEPILLYVWRIIAIASRIWIIPSAFTTMLMVLCICWYKLGHNIPNFVSWIQKIKNKIFSLDNEDVRNLNTSSSRNLSTHNRRNVSTHNRKKLSNRNRKKLKTNNRRNLNTSNSRNLNTSDTRNLTTSETSSSRSLNTSNSRNLNTSDTTSTRNLITSGTSSTRNINTSDTSRTRNLNTSDTSSTRNLNTSNTSSTRNINTSNTSSTRNLNTSDTSSTRNLNSFRSQFDQLLRNLNTLHSRNLNTSRTRILSMSEYAHELYRRTNPLQDPLRNVFPLPEPSTDFERLLNEMDTLINFSRMESFERITNFHLYRSSTIIPEEPRFNSDIPEFQRISEIPEWSFTVDSLQTPEGMHFCSKCTICQEDYIEGVKIRILQCGHNFHTDCVIRLIYERDLKCPLCRAQIFT
ncbi:hypothetical protein CHUAL_011318 [Chamberlinius hualienensis]